MDFLMGILKTMGPRALLGFLPMILVQIGTWLKGKDANNTGSDDVAGDICLAAAPAVEAFAQGNGNAFRKALVAIRAAIDNYLNSVPPGTPLISS